MKVIVKTVVPGTVLCDPSFATREGQKLRIGTSPLDGIRMAKLSHDVDFSIERYNRTRVCIQMGFHRAWLVVPSEISLYYSKDMAIEKMRKEPVLSILPVVAIAIMIWRRAYSKTDLATDDIYVDGNEFNGILPLIVAAACRPTVILSDQMPRDGIYQAVANLLQIDVNVKQAN